jgi:lysophospholipase L1-like esterase
LKLGPRLAAAGWTVEHRAIGGLTTRQACLQFTELPATTWAVLCFGGNDAAPWKQVQLAEFGANLGVLVGRCRSEQVLVLGPPPVVERPGETSGRTNVGLAAYAAVAADVASANGAHYLNLQDVLAAEGSHHVEDGVHLNDRAYAMLAGSVLFVLNRT